MPEGIKKKKYRKAVYIMKYNTIREATEAWVREFSAIPQSLIEKAYMGNNINK